MSREKHKYEPRFGPTLYFHRYWFVVLMFMGLGVVALNFDVYVAALANPESVRGDANRILKLSEFFAHGFGVGVVLIGVWVLVPDKRRFLPRLTVAAVFPSAVVHLFKILIARRRPIEFLRNFPDTVGETWNGFLPGTEGIGWNMEYAFQSFPSAHTATAVSFAIVLAWVFPRGRLFFAMLAALAASQRVVFEAHWLSDVLVGAAIGTMVGCAMTKTWGFGYWCWLFENWCSRKDAPDLQLHVDTEPAVSRNRRAA